jgi:hypothetical protein
MFHLNAEIQKKYLPPFAGPFPFLSIFSLHQSYVAEGRESETSGCSAARAAATRQGPPPAARWRNTPHCRPGIQRLADLLSPSPFLRWPARHGPAPEVTLPPERFLARSLCLSFSVTRTDETQEEVEGNCRGQLAKSPGHMAQQGTDQVSFLYSLTHNALRQYKCI